MTGKLLTFWLGLLVPLAAVPILTTAQTFPSAPSGAYLDAAAAAPQSNRTRAPQASVAGASVRVSEGYGRMPLHFEPNLGQAPRAAQFISRGGGYALYLTASGPVISMTNDGLASSFAGSSNANLTIRFAGGNPAPPMAGLAPLAGRVNYFRGGDPSKWLVNVPTFARVEYRDVYPGVDVFWYGNQRELEFDVVVAPGADFRAVRLDVSGARSIAIDGHGDVVLATAGGRMNLRKPYVYQNAGGERQEIEAAYVQLSGSEIGFRIGLYDTARPLVIDPVMDYSTYIGGSGFDQAYSIAVDATGNAYVVGVAFTADFPTTPGAFQTSPSGSDGFVTKLSADGNTFVYSTYLSGANCQGVAVDAAGNAYITGYAAINFPTTAGAFQTSLQGGFDAFVTRLSPDGASLVYSTILGGSFDDFGYDIALDAGGNAYVTGNTSYRAPGPGDFPTVNAFQPAYGGGTQDAFVTKVNSTGSALLYSTYLGGGSILNASEDWGEGITVDTAGSAYVTGETYSPDFPTTAGAFDRSRAGLDAFIVKFSPSGSSLVYSTFLGGNSRELGLDIAVDSTGHAYVTGQTESEDNPFTPAYDGFPTTPGAFQPTGSFDAFVTKLNPQGSALVYSTYLGGPDDEERAWGIAVDVSGNAHVAGDTRSTDLPLVDAVQPWYGGGLRDAFAAQLNAAGTALVYSTYLGGNLSDEARAIALSGDGANAYVVGSSSSFDFPTTPGVVQPLNSGGLEHHDDAIVVKISRATPPGETTTTLSLAPTSTVYGQNVSLTATVTARSASAAPAGTVTFYDGSSRIGLKTLSPSGVATVSKSNLTVGAHSLTAEYLPQDSSGGSTSAAVTLVVSKAATTLALVSSANPAAVGSTVTYTASIAVVSPGRGTPRGSVKFYDGTTMVGSKSLSGGAASLSVAYAAKGTHQIKAVYVGNAKFVTSVSPVVNQEVR